jgi:gas vesicle protein
MNFQPLLNTLVVLIPILVTCLAAWNTYVKEKTKQMQIDADRAVAVAKERSEGATIIAQLQKDVMEIYKWKDRLGPEHEILKKQLERLIEDFQDHLQGEIDRYRNQFKT